MTVIQMPPRDGQPGPRIWSADDERVTLGEAAPPLLLEALRRNRLTWLPEAGVGYYECETAGVYDQAYFDRYADQADSAIGAQLMAARVELVKRHVGDQALQMLTTLDVGIGSGAFVEAMQACGFPVAGYDVNPAGVAWLEARGLFRDVYAGSRLIPDCDNPDRAPRRDPDHSVVTFWDALEHIREPELALQRCAEWAFVAIPTFRDVAHVLASKHFRRDEHYWYFTRAGFCAFAESQDFTVVDIVATETAIGREDIETFVLRRHA